MLLFTIAGVLAVLSAGIILWQFESARQFGLHRRTKDGDEPPPVTILKPLKGADSETAACLRSWLAQDYPGPVQILFGVASAMDPACAVVEQLLAEFPRADARLVVCSESLGSNAKVSKLACLEREARHDVTVISDADVWAPDDFLRQCVAPLRDPRVGLVNCFYRLATQANLAMRWEAVAVNADFWTQVLQSRSLKPIDFALGAAVATRREVLAAIGGFESLVNYLADDYQLGNRVARAGLNIELCPVVVDCRSAEMSFREVWAHQLRWARTIRSSVPCLYFCTVLNNTTLWSILWLTLYARSSVALIAIGFIALRILTAQIQQARFEQRRVSLRYCLLVPVKDLLQLGIWLCCFLGNRVEWRGQQLRVLSDGRLAVLRPLDAPPDAV